MAKLDTSIDRLVEYIKMKKSCSVDDAAKSLGMPSKQIEELSEILAESGLIDVRYEFSGIRLFPKIVKKDTEEKGKAEKKANASDRVENIRRELQDAENMFVFSEKDILRKVENAKAHFREIEKLDLSSENMAAMRNKIRDLDGSIKVFEEKVESLEKAALDMRKEVDMFELQFEKQQTPKSKLRLPKLPLGRILSVIKGAFRRKHGEKKDVAEKTEQITLQ